MSIMLSSSMVLHAMRHAWREVVGVFSDLIARARRDKPGACSGIESYYDTKVGILHQCFSVSQKLIDHTTHLRIH